MRSIYLVRFIWGQGCPPYNIEHSSGSYSPSEGDAENCKRIAENCRELLGSALEQCSGDQQIMLILLVLWGIRTNTVAAAEAGGDESSEAPETL